VDAPPVYQQIAPRAFQLQQLGMNNAAIARRFGVTDKTVAKALIGKRHSLKPKTKHLDT